MTDQKTIADPGSLGLAAFAMTTFVLSVFNAGILDKAAEPVFLCLAWFYGGLVQLLAGMWEFKNRNMFGATAFSSYAASGLLILVGPRNRRRVLPSARHC